MELEHYEDNNVWRRRYYSLLWDLADSNNDLMDKIVSLQKEVRRLKLENKNLKKTKGRRK